MCLLSVIGFKELIGDALSHNGLNLDLNFPLFKVTKVSMCWPD